MRPPRLVVAHEAPRPCPRTSSSGDHQRIAAAAGPAVMISGPRQPTDRGRLSLWQLTVVSGPSGVAGFATPCWRSCSREHAFDRHPLFRSSAQPHPAGRVARDAAPRERGSDDHSERCGGLGDYPHARPASLRDPCPAPPRPTRQFLSSERACRQSMYRAHLQAAQSRASQLTVLCSAARRHLPLLHGHRPGRVSRATPRYRQIPFV